MIYNNINYFEELFKQAIINGTNFADNERIFPSNDNVFRITSKISTQFSIHITSKFRELLLANTDDKAAAPTDNTNFENIRGKYLLDLEKEKAAMDQEEKEYKAKKQTDKRKIWFYDRFNCLEDLKKAMGVQGTIYNLYEN
jgi:hypothetical protein